MFDRPSGFISFFIGFRFQKDCILEYACLLSKKNIEMTCFGMKMHYSEFPKDLTSYNTVKVCFLIYFVHRCLSLRVEFYFIYTKQILKRGKFYYLSA